MEEGGGNPSGHSCMKGEKEWQVTDTCCPSITLCFPAAMAFPSTAPLLWFVSNVLDLLTSNILKGHM